MAAFASISVEQLSRLVGTPNCPALIEVREAEGLAADPFLVPGSVRREATSVGSWGAEFRGRSVVTVCQKGKKFSEGASAWLRSEGIEAESLEGGIDAWRAAGLPVLPTAALPVSSGGGSVWVTRSRPKIDRIACPWLVRRFVDPGARFLFVAAAEVPDVAVRFGATPFDIEGVHWTHRGELCTFDVMIEEFGLSFDALARLALVVRGADTDRLDLAPEAPGLLAVSLGLSRMYSDDLQQLDAGMTIYDALYRWCRDATDETHNWPNSSVKR